MSAVFLKIKLKSLAAEARIIHSQERKTAGPYNALREELHRHRIDVVRRAARETHLAYGFLRGRAYRSIEQNACREPDWKAVGAMVKRYGTAEKAAGLEEWKSQE